MMGYKKIFLSLLLFTITASFAQSQNKDKKVVYILVDGIAEDMLDSAETPHLNKIRQEGIFLKTYVGGHKGEYNETPTISAVGYNSLLTGTWVNKHRVYGNYNQHPNYHYPSIFKLFKEQFPHKKIAIYSTWEDNRTVLIGTGLAATNYLQMDDAFDGLEKDTLEFPHDEEANYIKMIDLLVAEMASAQILEKGPDLTWVYLQHSDDVAHRYGDSPILWTNISYEDRLIGKVYRAVKERQEKYNEEWLFIVTTDHGRDSTGHGHGGQSERERNTWTVLNKPDVNGYAKNNRIGIVDLAPTILHFLGVQIPSSVQEEMDGVDILNPIDVYHLKAKISGNKLHVTWNTMEDLSPQRGELYLTHTNKFKEGGTDTYQSLGKVDIKRGEAELEIDRPTEKFYKLVLKTESGYLNTWVTQD